MKELKKALQEKKYWIFDMDGTLTVNVHDFKAIRNTLKIPQDKGILEYIETLPHTESNALLKKLDAIELELAYQSKAQDGAEELLDTLKHLGMRLGIVTRNSFYSACETLKHCRLLKYFNTMDIICREKAKPKPSPKGIQLLLSQWSGLPPYAVMVGDYYFDLLAGKNAGISTVYFDNQQKGMWKEYAEFTISNLAELYE